MTFHSQQTFSLLISWKDFVSAVGKLLPEPKQILGGIILAAAISSSQQANAATSVSISLDGNKLFEQVKESVESLIQAFNAATKPGIFSASQVDIADTPNRFLFNLSAINAITANQDWLVSYVGDNWRTSGLIKVFNNQDCSAAVAANCVIPDPDVIFGDSETDRLALQSATARHFNNAGINALEGKIHGVAEVLTLGPIRFEAASVPLAPGGVNSPPKVGKFGIVVDHSTLDGDHHIDSAEAFFDQIDISRDLVGSFDPTADADYQINGFAYTVNATHAVPGPLPLLGVGTFFGYTRKLRSLAKQHSKSTSKK